MVFKRLIIAIFVFSAAAAPVASARSIHADVDANMCIVDDGEQSPIIQFWDNLDAEARQERLSQLDSQDPGLKDAIDAYAAHAADGPPPDGLQRLIAATGAPEGLAMLIPQSTQDPQAKDGEPQEFKTRYTVAEAESTIATIDDDPGAKILTQLQSNSAALPIDTIRTELFSARKEEYNEIQGELKQEFQACVDEINDSKPIPPQYFLLGGGVLLAVLALALRAWSNSKKRSKHGVVSR